MTFGTIGLIIAAVVMEGGSAIDVILVRIFYVLFSGILASAICFTVWYYVLSQIDMTTATIATLLVPVFGSIFSAIMLNEIMSIGVIVCTGSVICGIVVAQKTGRAR